MDSYEDFLEGAFVVDEWNEGDDDEEEGDNENSKVIEKPTKESLTFTENKSKSDGVEEITKLSLTSEKDQSKHNDKKNKYSDDKKIDESSKISVTRSIKNKSEDDRANKIIVIKQNHSNKSRANVAKKIDEPIKKSETSNSNKNKADVVKKIDEPIKKSETSNSNKNKADVVKKIDEPIKKSETSISNKKKADVVKKIDEPIKKSETSISNKSKTDVVKKIDEPVKKSETSNSNESKADAVKKVNEPIKSETSISNKSKADTVKKVNEPIKKSETCISNKSKADAVKQVDEPIKKIIENKDEVTKKSVTSIKKNDRVIKNEDGVNKIVEAIKQDVTSIKNEDEEIKKLQQITDSPKRDKSKSNIVGAKKTEKCSTDSMSSVKDKDDSVEKVEEPIKELPTNVKNEDKQDGLKIKEESKKQSITSDYNKIQNVNKIATPVQKLMECNKDMRLKEILQDEEREILQLQIRLRDGTTSDVCSCSKDNANVWKYSCNPCNVRDKVWDIFSTHINSRNHANLLRFLEPVNLKNENSAEDGKSSEIQKKEDKTIEFQSTDESMKADELKNRDECEKVEESKNVEEFVKTIETEDKDVCHDADELQKTIESKKVNESVKVEKSVIGCEEPEEAIKTNEVLKTEELKNIKLENTIESNKTDELGKNETKMLGSLETNESEKTDKTYDTGKTNEVKKVDELERPDDLSKEEVKPEQSKKIVKRKEESSNKKVTCRIQKKLDSCEMPLIGLEYMLEVTTKGPDFYYCLLCDKRGEDHSFIRHFSRQKHYTQYLTMFFHSAADKLNLYYKIGKNHDLFNSLTDHVVARIEHVLGRLQPTQIKKETFLYNKFIVLDKIEKGTHLRETGQQNFVECVNVNHLKNNICMVGWRGKPEEPKQTNSLRNTEKHKSGPNLQERNSRDHFPPREPRSVGSGLHRKISTAESQFSTPPTGCERIKEPPCLIFEETKEPSDDMSGRSEEERRFYKFACSVQNLWQNYEERVRLIEEDLQKEMRFYQETPEQHPLYAEEWYAYCKRRSAKLEEMDQDPKKCSMNDNWFEFWDTRLTEWFKEIFEKNKLLLRQQLQLYHSEDNKGTAEVTCDDSYKWTKSVYDGTFKPMSHLSILTVLKRLSTLKPNLGPLGVKIDDLLTSALRLENSSKNGAEKLLLNKENCATLDKIREHLEYCLQSDRVQQDKITATESAILNIIDLLRSVSKRQRSSEKRYEDKQPTYTKQVFIRRDEKPSKKSTTFKISEINECIDKVGFLTHLIFPQRISIIQEIAAALFVRGLTEITEDDLLQLDKILAPRNTANTPEQSTTEETPLSVPIPKAIDMVFGEKKSTKRIRRSRSPSFSLSPDPKRTREKSPIKFLHHKFWDERHSMSPDRFRRNSRCRSPAPRVQTASCVSHFLDAPYKFWVRGDAAVGTVVGQIRLNEALYPKHLKMYYKLLHKYHEGVPISIEINSGTITVRDEVMKYNRMLFDFDVEVTDPLGLLIRTNCTVQVEQPAPTIPDNFGSAPMAKQENFPNNSSGEWIKPLMTMQPFPEVYSSTGYQDQQVFSIPVFQKEQAFIRPKFNQPIQAPGGMSNLKAILPAPKPKPISVITPLVPNPSGNAQQEFIPDGFNPQNQVPGGWNNMVPINQAPIPRPIPTITKTGPISSNVNVKSNLKVIESTEQNNVPLPGNNEPELTAMTGIEDQNNTKNEFCKLDNQYDEEEITFCKKLTSGPGSPVLRKYKRRTEVIESKLINEMKHYQDNPHKHELYQKELDLFWNIRGQPTTAQNRWYIIKSEFVPYWENLLKQLYQDKFKLVRSKLREEFINMYFDKKHLDQDRISQSSHSQEKRRDTKNSNRATPVSVRTKSTKRSPEKDRTKLQKNDNTLKRSKLDSERSSAKNDSAFKRAKLNYERTSTKNTIRSPEKNKTKLNSKQSSTKNTIRSPENKKPKIKESNKKDDTTIISVLRYISVLEKYLDSLGPKLLNIMSEALSIENLNSKANVQSFIAKNCVLLDTIKEKLLGLLEAGIIEKTFIKVAENGIDKINLLLSKVKDVPVHVRSNIDQTTSSQIPNDRIRNKKILKITEIAKFIENHDKLSHIPYAHRAAISQAVGTSLIYQNILEVSEEDTMVLVQATLNKLNLPLKDDSLRRSDNRSNFNVGHTEILEDFQNTSRKNVHHDDVSLNTPSKEESFYNVTKINTSERNFIDYRQQQSRNYKQLPNKDSSFNIPPKEDSFDKVNKPVKSIFQKLFPTYVPAKQDFNKSQYKPNIPPRDASLGSSNDTQTSNVKNTPDFGEFSNNGNLTHNTSVQRKKFVTITPPRPQRHGLFNHNHGKKN